MSSNNSNPIAQPEWVRPGAKKEPVVLKVNNSMTHTKTEFIPAEGKHVKWYTCGPTVYDSSHLGHARTYLAFDIMRRIMEEYFNYDILYVMNITDIDDKIIISARQKYLFKQRKASATALTADLIAEVKSAFVDFVDSKLGTWLAAGDRSTYDAVSTLFKGLEKVVANGGAPPVTEVPKFEMWFKIAKRSFAAIEEATAALAAGKTAKENADKLLDESADTLSTFLDKTLKETVTDPAIFRDYAAYWEDEYFKDMDALNIRRPDVLTRVSEYVPEIVDFVKKIIDNGYAYEADGSVYFDTNKFDKDPNHSYAKLEPWSASNVKLLQEGEGDLAAPGSGKRNKADFALWKGSKPGEPFWDSPWGQGRPGWHIECSAMSGDVLGDGLDIHAGGIDLAFPHHDNEIAQSEAHYNCRQWVNYFLHAGHLHIEGQKMSKSLKNFLTIRETLEKYSAVQLRLTFLLHSWDAVMDFKESSLQEAKVLEAAINNFMTNIKAIIQESKSQPPANSTVHAVNDHEKELLKSLIATQSTVHKALCDNFDTSTAMTTIRDLIASTNTYLRKAAVDRRRPAPEPLAKIAGYVTKILRTFGVFGDANPEFGNVSTEKGGAGGSVEDVAGPYVRLLASFRDKVRELARKKGDPLELLKLTDQLRDEELVELNVALDDRDDGRALVKFVPKEVILKQREEKKAALAAAQAEKEAKRKIEAEKEAEKLAKGATTPQQMFKEGENAGLYSKWDEKGIPTHKADGEELSKSGLKKLQKQWEAQEKLHEKYLAWKAKQ
ncbi:hypothetical protein HDU97_005786 [Phlyctochytrium planicorne]|nr:hypothetical protein HDU97_005786 [Phlyctochytrium planicorne]